MVRLVVIDGCTFEDWLFVVLLVEIDEVASHLWLEMGLPHYSCCSFESELHLVHVSQLDHCSLALR